MMPLDALAFCRDDHGMKTKASKVSETGGLPDDAIPAARAARLIGIHPTSMGRWVRQGRLRAWKRGSRCFVSEAEARAQVRPVEVSEGEVRLRTPQEDEAAAKAAVARIRVKGW
jgi:transposase-like protein